jgi:predicted metalloenzyme YecM
LFNLEALQQFLDRLFLHLDEVGIAVSAFELDHICYRVETMERYKELKTELQKRGTLLTESQIGGRPISSYKLHKPIQYLGRNIAVIELPAPKPGSHYPEGWEHVEFVLGYHPAKFLEQYPNLKFKTKALSKSINPDVSLQFDGFAVKFHEHSLAYVIQYLD